jgi:hypothetical protein
LMRNGGRSLSVIKQSSRNLRNDVRCYFLHSTRLRSSIQNFMRSEADQRR